MLQLVAELESMSLIPSLQQSPDTYFQFNVIEFTNLICFFKVYY